MFQYMIKSLRKHSKSHVKDNQELYKNFHNLKDKDPSNENVKFFPIDDQPIN